jgi:hypothetical protein
MSDPLPDRIRAQHGVDNEFRWAADTIERIYDGDLKLTVMEALFCLGQICQQTLERRYPNMLARVPSHFEEQEL